MTTQYVLYRPEVEIIDEHEEQVIGDILASMHRLDDRTKAMYGRHVRTSHAKSHGLAVGQLTVLDNLPEHLAQGLFAQPGTYGVIVRLANVPGEIVPDAVNTQRGFSFKILGVEGPKLPGHEGQTTQDFILDSGTTYFPNADMKSFLLLQRTLIEHLPKVPDGIKEAVSTAARVTNEALSVVGLDNAKLNFAGDARVNPVAEAYYSQVPIRYGTYIAKLAVVPVSSAQKALADVELDSTDPNALRTATVGYLKNHDAEFEIRIQLCTDLEKMPVEDANKEWNEEDSPYLPVARIILPRQDAYSEARQQYVEALSFCPSHSLEAHRPLGSIMRARLRVYPEMSRHRRAGNHQPLGEPTSLEAIPA